MLFSFTPAPPRKRRKAAIAAGEQPPVEFMLTAATYNAGDQSVTLTFSQPIDIGGLDAGQVVVWDNEQTLQTYLGWSATLLSPASVKIGLESQTVSTGEGIILNVSEDNGIRAADEGPVWNGVIDLTLPFP